MFNGLFRLLPLDLALRLGGQLFRLVGAFTRTHTVAEQNLMLAFPEQDEAWRRRILADQWESNGRTAAGFPNMDRILPYTGQVEVVNGERLAEIARPDIAEAVRRITALVEDQIRKRPAEWFWMYRRWAKDACRGLAADDD